MRRALRWKIPTKTLIKFLLNTISGHAIMLDEDELSGLRGFRDFGIRSKTEVGRASLSEPQLGAIGLSHRHKPDCFGPGFRPGVAVFNAPYSNTRSVVEPVMVETLRRRGRFHCRSCTAVFGRSYKRI